MNATNGLYSIAIVVMALFVYTYPMYNQKPTDQDDRYGKKSAFHMCGHLRKTRASVDKVAAKKAIELQELQKQLAATAIMHEEVTALEDQMSAIRSDYFSKTELANKNLRAYQTHHDNQLHHVEAQLQHVGTRLSELNNSLNILERAIPHTLR